MIRVVLADDHPTFLHGLMRVMADAPDVEVVGTAENGLTALEVIREVTPDVVVLDHLMPNLDGMSVLARIKEEQLLAHVAMLSGAIFPEAVEQALRAGATAYLMKTAPTAEIVEAIRCAARSEVVLPPGVLAILREGLHHDHATLTPREQEVLQYTAEGKCISEIAEALFLGERTVKRHLSGLYAKLGVHKAPQAVAEAMRRGLLR